MDVFSIATQQPKYVSPEETVITAIELMAKYKFRRIPVVFKDPTYEAEQLIGIITASDVLRMLSEEGVKVLNAKVGEVMIEEPLAVLREEDLGRATQIMSQNGFGGLPIVSDEYHTLCGIITERDIVKAFVNSIADATLSEFMQEPVTLKLAKSKLIDAIKKMVATKSSRVILMSPKDKIEGIITSSDILRFITDSFISNEEELDANLLKTSIKDIGKRMVTTVNETQSVSEVASFLLKNKLGGVPVVNDDGILVGLFSERELLELIGTFGLL